VRRIPRGRAEDRAVEACRCTSPVRRLTPVLILIDRFPREGQGDHRPRERLTPGKLTLVPATIRADLTSAPRTRCRTARDALKPSHGRRQVPGRWDDISPSGQENSRAGDTRARQAGLAGQAFDLRGCPLLRTCHLDAGVVVDGPQGEGINVRGSPTGGECLPLRDSAVRCARRWHPTARGLDCTGRSGQNGGAPSAGN